MAASGWHYRFGLGFWGPNGHDAIWHLALMRQVTKHFPPLNPVFAPFPLYNYHFGFDLLAGWLGKIFHLGLLDVYFRFLPLLFALAIGWLSFRLAFMLSGRFWIAFWFMFLNYFAGSFGWVVTLGRSGHLGGESLFWSMQSISTLLNPPYALSLVVILLLLIALKKWHSLTWGRIIILGIGFGLLFEIKAYGGLVAFGGLLAWSFYMFFGKGKKKIFAISLLTVLLAGFLFSISGRRATGLFVWRPWWFIHTMVEARDRLYWPHLALMRYALAGHWSPRFFALEFLGLLIFLIGNLGTRLLGVLSLRSPRSNLEWFWLGAWSTALLPPLFFIQKGTPWNVIQFMYYFLFFANYYLAIFLADLSEKQSLWRWLLLLVIILATIPTTLGSLKDYLGYPPPASLPQDEENALAFLAKQPAGTVLTFPHDYYCSRPRTPRPLYCYITSAYVAAFSGQLVFLEDEMNLNITGYPWRQRRRQEEEFFHPDGSRFAKRGFLLNHKIRYIYLVDKQKLPLSEAALGLKVLFRNNRVRIYQVMR